MICKIWPINANFRGDATASKILKDIQQSIDYVCDEEKTNTNANTNEDILENEMQYINFEQDASQVLEYMKNEHKTKKIYVTGYLCDPNDAIKNFRLVKEINLNRVGKTLADDLGAQAFHIVQSFPDDLNISDEEVHQCGIELCKKLEKYQAVITSHLHSIYDENGVEKGKCKHNHIIINSHMHPDFIDLNHPEVMKYNNCKSTYAQLREWNDEIAIEHGLPIIMESEINSSYNWYASEMENQGKSWKQKVRLDIENAKYMSSTWEEFKAIMKKNNYIINEGKHETYITPHQQKVRGKTLGEEYTKEYLQGYWEFKNQLLEEKNEELKAESKENLSYVALMKLIESNSNCFISVPRKNKIDGKKYTLKFPLSKQQNENIVDNYIFDNNIYPVYSNENDYIGQALGKDIKTVLFSREYNTYYEQKAWEDFETKQKEQEDINKILKSQKEEEYLQEQWRNSRNNKPYKVGLYDSEGNKRTLLEQILILAIVVMTNETPEFVYSERDKLYMSSDLKSKSAIINKEPSYKIKAILDAIKFTRDENIEDLNQLKNELDLCGKKISQIKASQRKNESVKQKMEPIKNALDILNDLEEYCENILNMEDGSDKDKVLSREYEKLNKYKTAKATLYHYKIDSAEKREDFISRYQFNVNREKILKEEYNTHIKRYSRLKKIDYQVKLAMNKDYCYGTRENDSKFKEQKQTQNEYVQE